jgi:hypothetical protein
MLHKLHILKATELNYTELASCGCINFTTPNTLPSSSSEYLSLRDPAVAQRIPEMSRVTPDVTYGEICDDDGLAQKD